MGPIEFEIWFMCNMLMRYRQEVVQKITASLLDITERKETEEQHLSKNYIQIGFLSR
ncbi:hypothetical protein MKX01_024256, partial [Papaver californicum]